MFNLAAAVVDFYDDPEFTKESEVFGEALVPSDKTHTLRDVDFAVKIATSIGEHRKFPIYNKTATALSGLYFDRIAETLPDGIRKVAGYYLRAAHDRFDVSLPRTLCTPFESVDSRCVSFEKEAMPAGLYEGAELFKMAQEMFEDNFSRMTAVERVNRANDLLKAAQVEGLDITSRIVWDYVPKDHYGPLLEGALNQREVLVQEEPLLKQAFADVLKELPELSPFEGPFLVYHFDKVAGLDRKYRDGSVTDPFYAAWGGEPCFEKEAVRVSELEYKIETVARGGLVGKILGEKAQADFARDPRGTYDKWKAESPDKARVVDTLMKGIGGEIADDKKLTAAEQKSSKEAKPEDRPAEGNAPDWRSRLRVGL